jgi:hypothetical protein
MTMTPEQQARLLATFHTEQANAQRIGQTVLILMGEYQNTLGKVYAYLPGWEHPWLVRPCSWPDTVPGIAYTSEELVFGSPKATVRVSCEACGVLFEPEHGYYEVDRPEHQRIGYAYCSECCHW